MVRRRIVRSRVTCSRGGSQKRGPEGEPEDHALGRSRGGYGTKFHLVTDGRGLPLSVTVTPGQAHESKSFEHVLDAVVVPQHRPGRPRRRPDSIAADKGYSFRRIRRWLHRHKIEPVIPQRSNQEGRVGGHRKFDKAKYRQRNVVERCVGWLKESRRIGTRYEKLALNFLAMLKLAFVLRYLRVLA